MAPLKKPLQYLGIFLGAAYGYSYRMLCGAEGIGESYSIHSLSFIWLLPLAISVIPLVFARKEMRESGWKAFAFPFFSILLFLLLALSSGMEDWLCTLIITIPFLLVAGAVGLLTLPLLQRLPSPVFYSITLLPLILNPLESLIPNPTEHFRVETSLLIHASRQTVWKNLVEVPEILEEEYGKGLLNFIGVPRPIKSELHKIGGIEYRIGYFSEGLKLYETISRIDTAHFVEFHIHMSQSELRDVPTDRDLLNSGYFHFENIAYRLKEAGDGKTELILSCTYNMNSKMNGYANFWASNIIKDFETRLLASLKLKIEKASP
jgi:hypothetical protein